MACRGYSFRRRSCNSPIELYRQMYMLFESNIAYYQTLSSVKNSEFYFMSGVNG